MRKPLASDMGERRFLIIMYLFVKNLVFIGFLYNYISFQEGGGVI